MAMERDMILGLWIDCEPPLRSGQQTIIVPLPPPVICPKCKVPFQKRRCPRCGKRQKPRFAQVQTAEYKQTLKGMARLLFAHLPADWTPVAAPVLLRLDIVVPHRQAEPKAHRGLYFPLDVTPDADNVCKFYGDALEQATYVVNDKLLHPLILRWWGPRPGLRIRMWPLTPQVSLDQVGGLAFAQENA